MTPNRSCERSDASYRRLEWIDGKLLKEERRSLVHAYNVRLDKGTAPTQVPFYATHALIDTQYRGFSVPLAF